MSETKDVSLPTGNLALHVTKGPPIDLLCDFAARANPRRGFLIVSKVLGRHLPARPRQMRETMRYLGANIPRTLPGPIVFLGMAETATALGQGVFAAYQALNRRETSIYLQTSRQRMPGAEMVTAFEEGHSHASTHIVQKAAPGISSTLRKARTLVIVDDECSTGNTFIAAARAMAAHMPHLKHVETVCITDWSNGAYLASMPVRTTSTSILIGRMSWQAGATPPAATLHAGSNEHGRAPLTGMRSRGGIFGQEMGSYSLPPIAVGERVLVLGEGEFSYQALLIAEQVERLGGIAAVQCITRSPALPGHAMQSVSHFTDTYGSGAPCFLYNILGHQPDRILIAAEVEGSQAEEARAAVQSLGSDIPVDLILCSFEKAA